MSSVPTVSPTNTRTICAVSSGYGTRTISGVVLPSRQRTDCILGKSLECYLERFLLARVP